VVVVSALQKELEQGKFCEMVATPAQSSDRRPVIKPPE